MPGAGLEPAWKNPTDFKSVASRHFATRARFSINVASRAEKSRAFDKKKHSESRKAQFSSVLSPECHSLCPGLLWDSCGIVAAFSGLALDFASSRPILFQNIILSTDPTALPSKDGSAPDLFRRINMKGIRC